MSSPGFIVNFRLNDTWGVQGGFITPEEFRGKGVGGEILQEGFDWLGDINLFAAALPVMRETYRRYGYVLDHNDDIFYSGCLTKSGILSQTQAPRLEAGVDMVGLEEVDFRKIMIYDRTHHPYSLPRTNYLKWHLYQDSSKGYAILKGDEVIALGARSDYEGGAFLGPIYGRNSLHGEFLLRQLLSEIPEGTTCHICIPKDNAKASQLITGAGLQAEGYSTRVFTKFKYEMDFDQFYGYTIAGYLGLFLSWTPKDLQANTPKTKQSKLL